MAVANTFTFGNVNTQDFGVVIEGYGNYTAPKRAVEMVTVPGRDGSIAIDQGRYEDGEATYSVIIRGKTPYEFARKVSEFRNAIISQLGYQKLSEDYLPSEYRMAMYSGGLEKEPDFIGRAGRFEVKFTCKPRRYLLSGEPEMSIVSGASIYNPTPYGANPLIIVEGAGSMSINGQTISVAGSPVGEINLTPLGGFEEVSSKVISMPDAVMLADLDELHVCFGVYLEFTAASGYTIGGIGEEETRDSGRQPENIVYNLNPSYKKATVSYMFNLTYHKDVDSTEESETGLHLVVSGNTYDYTVRTTVAYDGDNTVVISVALVTVSAGSLASNTALGISQGRSYGISSISAATEPVIIDTEIGEGYIEKRGQIIPLNSKISLGSDLPVLDSGENAITYTGFTSVKIRPRWWIL